MLRIATIKDLFKPGMDTCEIVCAIKGTIVRRLSLDGPEVRIDPIVGEPVQVWLKTPIEYEPWIMDRGSLLFPCPGYGMAKLCTEHDLVRWPDGSEAHLWPSR